MTGVEPTPGGLRVVDTLIMVVLVLGGVIVVYVVVTGYIVYTVDTSTGLLAAWAPGTATVPLIALK